MTRRWKQTWRGMCAPGGVGCLARARKELASYYPTYAEFEPLVPGNELETRPMQLLEVDEEGVAQLDPLNAEFDAAYLKDSAQPALDGKAHGRLSLGAHRDVQAVPGDPSAAQDAMVVQERPQTRVAHDGAKGRPDRCCLRRARRRATEWRQRGTKAGTRQTCRSGHHVAHRRYLPMLRYDHGDGGYPFRRSRWPVGSGDDDGGGRWSEGQGIPSAYRS